MATALTPVALSHKALTALGTPTAADVTGNTFPNGGSTFVYLANGATERTVTVAFARGVDGTLPAPRSFTVAANFIGFLKIGAPSDFGTVATITGSNADLTVKVFQL